MVIPFNMACKLLRDNILSFRSVCAAPSPTCSGQARTMSRLFRAPSRVKPNTIFLCCGEASSLQRSSDLFLPPQASPRGTSWTLWVWGRAGAGSPLLHPHLWLILQSLLCLSALTKCLMLSVNHIKKLQ